MSGSGAGLAASTARPDWQVDIPSLSRLLLSAGSQGLKQLANDGVDPHTLGCMLMIAEYTPASEEFRRALTETRQRQRSGKSLWLYKVIEIGASTNFIADQLLKTRAGENVIALLSATASFTSDSTTTSIISALFELAKVPLNDTPGTAQIAQFRKALMPLVLKLGFKEKLFYHHYYFQGLKGEVNSAANVMEAIPSVKSLSKLIPMIYRVATSKEGHVLACHGFAGAAWIATYSSYILGLNVTAIDAEGRTHQIYYGPYEDARIIIDLSKQISPETANCGLYINGNPQDFFCVKPDPIPSGWTIDCSMLNLLETRLPGIMDCEDLRLISACAAIETMNRVSRMAELFVRCCPIETNRGHWLGLRPLNLHVLPNLQDRSLRILEIFGFCPGPRDRYEFMAHLHCPAYLCTGLRNDGRPTEEGRSVRLCKELAPPVLQSLHKSNPVYEKYCHVATAHSSIDSNSVLKSLKDFVGGISPSEGPSRSKSHRGSSTSFRDLFKDWQSTMQMDLANLISALVHCAATLAFTDWDESLQQLSVRATIACRKADWGGWISRRDSHTWFFDEHIRKILDVCIDNSNRQRNNLQDLPQSWIASELDGTAVMRKHAIEASLAKLDGHFLRLRPGLIRFEGSSCTSIQAVDAFRGLDLGDVRHGGAVAQSSKIITGPCNIADKILMQSLCHREGSIIWVRSEVCLSESVRKIDLVRICKGIPHLKVSTPCIHGYRAPSKLLHAMSTDSQDAVANTSDGGLPPLCSWKIRRQAHQGLFVEWFSANHEPFTDAYWTRSHEEPLANIYYQLTDNNSLAQWAACHVGRSHRTIMVLQKDCCVDCVLMRIDTGLESMADELRSEQWANEAMPETAAVHIVIIAGGQDGDSKSSTWMPRSDIPVDVPVFDEEVQNCMPGFGFKHLRWL